MNLYEARMEDCVMMDETTVSDGIGGTITRWQEGAEFKAAIIRDDSTEARLAESANARSLYTVTTNKNVNLPFNKVFKRVSDGKYLRATSNNQEKIVPASASFSFAQCSAEGWELRI